MSTEDSPGTHRRHIDWMEQPEKLGTMNLNSLHLCQCVLQYFEFVAIWLEEENVGGITSLVYVQSRRWWNGTTTNGWSFLRV